MLNNQDLAALTNKLQIPQITDDVINENEELTDDLRYALHDALSDQQPDSALLSIALAAQKIAMRNKATHISLILLKMETVRIIDDYAQMWLEHAHKNTLSDKEVLDQLSYLPEDLASISELLETASAYLQKEHKHIAELCRILAVQANAHSLIAECYTEKLNDIETFCKAPANGSAIETSIAEGNNIIRFPHRA